jgi:hypothetical protein
VPGGGSKKEVIADVGVDGNGEFWPRIAETNERGAKDDPGDTGEGGDSKSLKLLAVIAIPSIHSLETRGRTSYRRCKAIVLCLVRTGRYLGDCQLSSSYVYTIIIKEDLLYVSDQ